MGPSFSALPRHGHLHRDSPSKQSVCPSRFRSPQQGRQTANPSVYWRRFVTFEGLFSFFWFFFKCCLCVFYVIFFFVFFYVLDLGSSCVYDDWNMWFFHVCVAVYTPVLVLMHPCCCVYMYIAYRCSYTFKHTIHACISSYMYLHMHLQIFMNVFTYSFIYLHTCMYINTYALTNLHACTYTPRYLHACTYIHKYRHTYTHIFWCMHLHTFMHALTYIHTFDKCM
jgi:hypothetical protein